MKLSGYLPKSTARKDSSESLSFCDLVHLKTFFFLEPISLSPLNLNPLTSLHRAHNPNGDFPRTHKRLGFTVVSSQSIVIKGLKPTNQVVRNGGSWHWIGLQLCCTIPNLSSFGQSSLPRVHSDIQLHLGSHSEMCAMPSARQRIAHNLLLQNQKLRLTELSGISGPITVRPFLAHKEFSNNDLVGEGVQFPWRDPADPSTTINHPQLASNVLISENNKISQDNSSIVLQSATTSSDAEKTKATLEAMWANNQRLKGYEPQLGWNPATGEPWLAIRCYVRNAFPALVGPNHQYLHDLARRVPEFKLRYERFPIDGYTLIWPEFARPTDLVNQAIWKKFGNFRAFLEEWTASGQQQCVPIHQAYRSFKEKKGSAALSVSYPPGFRPDVSRFRDLAYKVTNRKTGRR